MKPRLGSAIFPLSIMLALAALTFWLRYVTEFSDESRDWKSRHDPDYVISDAVLRKLDATGRLQYTLNAREVRHYPDDETTELATPRLVHLDLKKPTVTVTADRGHLSKRGEQVDLYGNVRVVRAATPTEAAMIVTTTELTVLPDDEKAFTKKPVEINQGNSWIKAVGMQIDNRNQTYVLESRATASIESKAAKNKKP